MGLDVIAIMGSPGFTVNVIVLDFESIAYSSISAYASLVELLFVDFNLADIANDMDLLFFQRMLVVLIAMLLEQLGLGLKPLKPMLNLYQTTLI